MSPPVTHPPGRGTLAAIGLLASLITSLFSPLASDLKAQGLAYEHEPTDATAGEIIMPAVQVRAPNLGLGGVTVTLSVASGPGQLDGSVSRTTAAISDIATFDDLNIDEAGTYTLLAEADGYTDAVSGSFTISPGPASADESRITASPTSIPADGASTSTITVTLFDEFGNELDQGGDTVTLAKSGGGTLSANPPTDNGDGTYTGTLTSDTSPETVTVTGTVNGEDIDDTAQVTFTAAEATQLDFGQQPTAETAGDVITPAVTVRAEDANGNLDTSFSGTVSLTIASGPAGATLGGTTSRAAVNGIATFGNLFLERAGTYTLEASSGSLDEDTSVPFQISPGPPSGATSEITASPTSIPADGSSTSTITVQLRDEFGNDLVTGGDDVDLETTLGTLGAVSDEGDGSYTATLTAPTVTGTATITGEVNGDDIDATATVSFTLVGSPSLVVDVQPVDTPVDQPIDPAVVVRVVDGLGNTLTGFTGNVTANLAANPAGGSLGGDRVEPLQGGIATFDDLRINRSGSGYRLGFSVPGAASATSAPFTVTAGAASGGTSTIAASPVTIPADGASTSTITVQLRDAVGVPLSSGGDDVDLSATLGFLGPIRDNGNGTYTAPLRSTVAPGTATVSGTVNGDPIADTATVTFAAGSADVEVEVEVSDETPETGDEVVYVVTVHNQGPDVATGLEITQTLPSRLQFVSATTSQGTYASTTGVWSVGTVAVGARATLTLVVRVQGLDGD